MATRLSKRSLNSGRTWLWWTSTSAEKAGSTLRAGGGTARMTLPRPHPDLHRDESEYADLIAASPALGFIAKTDFTGSSVHDLVHAHRLGHRFSRARKQRLGSRRLAPAPRWTRVAPASGPRTIGRCTTVVAGVRTASSWHTRRGLAAEPEPDDRGPRLAPSPLIGPRPPQRDRTATVPGDDTRGISRAALGGVACE